MPILPFIQDAIFEQIVLDLLSEGKKAKQITETRFNRNVIDPFAVLFEMASFEIDSKTWLLNEKIRQAQKTLSNAIGMFHQKILGSVDGWQDLGKNGIVDLVNNDLKLIAEIKNKHNTVKGSDKVNTYDTLNDLVMKKGHLYKDYTAYYVEIIPSKAHIFDHMFTPSDKSQGCKRSGNEKIRHIDGNSFYAKVTGVPTALQMVFEAIFVVIQKYYPHFNDREFIQKYFIDAFGENPLTLIK